MTEPIIIKQTKQYIVINKPAGMAVEPPSHQLTLRDWLLEKGLITPDNWKEEERLGVVHRLDTDTSGVLIWALTPEKQSELKLLWQGRQSQKTYLALVEGECPEQGSIELAIERDNKNDRQKVVWLYGNGRPAITHYHRLEVGSAGNDPVSLVEAKPITGRTHQIRVHFQAIGHSIIGDLLYGTKKTREIADYLDLHRQFLHAWKLTINGEEFIAALPPELLTSLKKAGLKFQVEP